MREAEKLNGVGLTLLIIDWVIDHVPSSNSVVSIAGILDRDKVHERLVDE